MFSKTRLKCFAGTGVQRFSLMVRPPILDDVQAFFCKGVSFLTTTASFGYKGTICTHPEQTDFNIYLSIFYIIYFLCLRGKGAYRRNMIQLLRDFELKIKLIIFRVYAGAGIVVGKL